MNEENRTLADNAYDYAIEQPDYKKTVEIDGIEIKNDDLAPVERELIGDMEFSDYERDKRRNLAVAHARNLMTADLSRMDEASKIGLFRATTKGIFGLVNDDGSFWFGPKSRGASVDSNIENLKRFINGDANVIKSDEEIEWDALPDDETTRFKYALEHISDVGRVRGETNGSWKEPWYERLGRLMGAATVSPSVSGVIPTAEDYQRSAEAVREDRRKNDYEQMSPEDQAKYRAGVIRDYEKQLAKGNPFETFLRITGGMTDMGNAALAKAYSDGGIDENVLVKLTQQDQDALLTGVSIMRGDLKGDWLFDFYDDDGDKNDLAMNLHALGTAAKDLVTAPFELIGDFSKWTYGKTLLEGQARENFFDRWNREQRIKDAFEKKLPEAQSMWTAPWRVLAENSHWVAGYGLARFGKGVASAAKAASAGLTKGIASNGALLASSTAKLNKLSNAVSAAQTTGTELENIERYRHVMTKLAASVEKYTESLDKLRAFEGNMGHVFKKRLALGRTAWAYGRGMTYGSFVEEFVGTCDANGISREYSIPTALAVGYINDKVEALNIPYMESGMTRAEIKNVSFLELFRGAKFTKWAKNYAAQTVKHGPRTAATENIEEVLQGITTEFGMNLDRKAEELRTKGDAGAADYLVAMARAVTDTSDNTLGLMYETVKEMASADIAYTLAGNAQRALGQHGRNAARRWYNGRLYTASVAEAKKNGTPIPVEPKMQYGGGVYSTDYHEGVLEVIQKRNAAKKEMAKFWSEDENGGEAKIDQGVNNDFRDLLTEARKIYGQLGNTAETTTAFMREFGLNQNLAETIQDLVKAESDLADTDATTRILNEQEGAVDITDENAKYIIPGYVAGSLKRIDTLNGDTIYQANASVGSKTIKVAYSHTDFSNLIGPTYENLKNFGESWNASIDNGKIFAARWEKLSYKQQIEEFNKHQQEGAYKTSPGKFSITTDDGETVEVDADALVLLANGHVGDIGYGSKASNATARHETFHAIWEFAKATFTDDEKKELQRLEDIIKTMYPEESADSSVDEILANQLEQWAMGGYVDMEFSNKFDKMMSGFFGKFLKGLQKLGLTTQPIYAKTGKPFQLADVMEAIMRGELGSGNLGIERVIVQKPTSEGKADTGKVDTGSEIPVEVTGADRAGNEAANASAVEHANASVGGERNEPEAKLVEYTLDNPAPANASVAPNARFYRVSAGDGVNIVGELVVSDARELKTSYKGNLTDASLQNRGETEEGRSLVEKIAGNPDPMQVGTIQPRANNGFIWSMPNGDVFIGNTRESGITLAYEKGNGARVKAYMIEEAARHGLAVPEGVEYPVVHFVLRRIESTDGAATIQDVVRMTNESVNRGMNAAEQAKNDADVLEKTGIISGIVIRPDGRIDTEKSSGAIGRFRRETGAQGMIDESTGLLTEDGQKRLGSAILANLLGNENADILKKMIAESGHLDMGNETMAIMRAATEIIDLAKAKPVYDIRKPLAEALRYYVEWRNMDETRRADAGKTRKDWNAKNADGTRKRGLSWADYIGQGDMFRKPSVEAATIGDLFAAARDLRSFEADDTETMSGKRRAQELIGKYIDDVIANARAANTETVDLFGGEPATLGEIMAAKRANGVVGGVRFSVRNIENLYHGSATEWTVPNLAYVGSGQGQQVQGTGLNLTSDKEDAEMWGRLAARNRRPRNFLEKVGRMLGFEESHLYKGALEGANVVGYFEVEDGAADKLVAAVDNAGYVFKDDFFSGKMRPTVQNMERFLSYAVRHADGTALTPSERARMMVEAGIDANVVDPGTENLPTRYVVYNTNKLNIGPVKFSVSQPMKKIPIDAAFIEKMVEKYGTTDKVSEAQWMLPDGRMLKSVGYKSFYGVSYAHNYLIGDVAGRHDLGNEDDFAKRDAAYTAAIRELSDAGFVRIESGGEGLEFYGRPNKTQLEEMYDLIPGVESYVGDCGYSDFFVDVNDNEGNQLFSVQYPIGVSARRVVEDLKGWYDHAVVPMNATGALVEQRMMDGLKFSVAPVIAISPYVRNNTMDGDVMEPATVGRMDTSENRTFSGRTVWDAYASLEHFKAAFISRMYRAGINLVLPGGFWDNLGVRYGGHEITVPFVHRNNDIVASGDKLSLRGGDNQTRDVYDRIAKWANGTWSADNLKKLDGYEILLSMSAIADSDRLDKMDTRSVLALMNDFNGVKNVLAALVREHDRTTQAKWNNRKHTVGSYNINPNNGGRAITMLDWRTLAENGAHEVFNDDSLFNMETLNDLEYLDNYSEIDPAYTAKLFLTRLDKSDFVNRINKPILKELEGVSGFAHIAARVEEFSTPSKYAKEKIINKLMRLVIDKIVFDSSLSPHIVEYKNNEDGSISWNGLNVVDNGPVIFITDDLGDGSVARDVVASYNSRYYGKSRKNIVVSSTARMGDQITPTESWLNSSSEFDNINDVPEKEIEYASESERVPGIYQVRQGPGYTASFQEGDSGVQGARGYGVYGSVRLRKGNAEVQSQSEWLKKAVSEYVGREDGYKYLTGGEISHLLSAGKIKFSVTQAQFEEANKTLPSLFGEDEVTRIRTNLKRLKDTPWYGQAVQSILIRKDMMDILSGRAPKAKSKLLAPSAAEARKAIENGEAGIFAYLRKTGVLGHAAKPVNAVNSSFINCEPSAECAKFCYASTGNYAFPIPAVKSEMVSWAVQKDPIRMAEQIAAEYKMTPEYETGKALRLFDKGDIGPEWLPVIQRGNELGVVFQIFAKRPELLQHVDQKRNVVMLSVDRSNLDVANDWKDLPLSFVFKDVHDVAFLESQRERYERLGGVVLPITDQSGILPDEVLGAIPTWARAYTCPINRGTIDIKSRTNPLGWTCTKCDARSGSGMGCFYHRTSAMMMKIKKEINEGGNRDDIRRALGLLERGIVEHVREGSERSRLLDQLASIRNSILSNADGRTAESVFSTAAGEDGRRRSGAAGAGRDVGFESAADAVIADEEDEDKASFSVSNRKYDWDEYEGLAPNVFATTSHIHMVGHDDPLTHELYEQFKAVKRYDSDKAYGMALWMTRSKWDKKRILGRYLLGKHFGDLESADDAVRYYYDHNNTASLRAAAVATERPVRWVFVGGEDGKSQNRIPEAYAKLLAEKFGGTADGGVRKVSGDKNTGAEMVTRGRSDFAWDGNVDLAGNPSVFIVDDVWTTGSTTVSMLEYLHGLGADVRGIAVVATASNGDHIKPTVDDIGALLDKGGFKTVDAVNKFIGMNIRRLTGSEITAYVDKGGSGKGGLARWFERARPINEMRGGLFEGVKFSVSGGINQQFSNLSRMGDEDLLTAALAQRMALYDSENKEPGKRNPAHIETFQRTVDRVKSLHPEWETSKAASVANKIRMNAFRLSKQIRKDLESGVSDSEIIKRLPKKMHGMFGSELHRQRRAGGKLGIGISRAMDELANRQARIVSDAVRNQTGIAVTDFENAYGINLTQTIMNLENNPRLRKDENGTLVVTGGGSAANDNEGAHDPDESGLPSVEEKVQRAVDDIVKTTGEKAKVENANAESAKQQADKDKAVQEEFNAAEGDEGGGEVDIGDPVEVAVKRAKVDLKDPRHLALFIMELARRHWVKTHGLALDAEAWDSPVAFQFLRKTAENIYGKLLQDLTYSQGREAALKTVAGFSTIPTVRGLKSEMEYVGGIINARMIRDSQEEMVNGLDNFLKDNFGATGRFKADDEKLRRKVPAELQLRAIYTRHAIWLTPQAVEEEAAELQREIDVATGEFEAEGHDKDNARMVVDAIRKLNILREFGALRYKPLSVIENAIQWWMDAQTGANLDKAQEWEEREIRTKKAAEILANAFRNVKLKFSKEGTGGLIALNGYLQSHMGFMHFLRDLTRYASNTDRAQAERILKWLELEIQKAGTKSMSEKRKHSDALAKAVEKIYGVSVDKVIADLNATDERFTRFMGSVDGKPVRATRGRAIQLMTSLQQVGNLVLIPNKEKPGEVIEQWIGGYHDNILAHHREGQAVEIERMLSAQDLQLVQWLRSWYEQNRAELSDICEDIFGIGVYAETANYMPVKMLMEKQGLEKGDSVGWTIFPKALTPRVRNERDFDTSADVLQMFMSRMQEAAQWKAHAKLGLEMRGIFGRTELQQAVIASHGDKARRAMLGFITDILSGEGNIKSNDSDFTRFIDTVRGWAALGALGGNVGVMLKQTTSIPAFGFEIGMGKVASHMLTALTPAGMEAMRAIWNSEERRNRWNVGNSEAVAHALAQKDGSLFKKLWKATMITNRVGDAVPALVIGQGIYRDALERGMGERDAMAYTWMLVERTQQSGRVENQASFQRRNKAGNVIYQFLSTQQQYLNYELRGIREVVADPNNLEKWGNLGSALLINHFLLSSAYFWMGQLFKAMLGEEPDDERLADWAIAIMLGPWGALYGAGFTCTEALNTWVRGYKFGSKNPAPSLAWLSTIFIRDPGKVIGDIKDEGKTWDDVIDDLVKWCSDFNATFRDTTKLIKNRILDD